MSQRIYLLDTSVILPLVRGNALGRYIDERFGLRSAAQRPLVSVVSLGEVRALALRNAWGDAKLKALSNALDNLVVVDINHPAVLDAYVQLDLVSQSHPDGARNMGKNDLWIEACAKASGATLLTTDDDFSHLIPEHLDGEVIAPMMASRHKGD
ncbi:PIN domain-containing protein [Sorangium sp. So ce204]|uniref:PIN domain-containing protein n=1 Tax=Sorangium sp. So ce204 TaxID=3133288 RepID=UPI003F5DD75A